MKKLKHFYKYDANKISKKTNLIFLKIQVLVKTL